MKIAAHVLAYDVDRFINAMLRNLGPWVDRIYLAYPDRPFGYVASSRETKKNPTALEAIDFGAYADKIEVLRGDWEKEEDTRNACLERAKADGYDWLIIQDADEFYTSSRWQNIVAVLRRDEDVELYRTTWFTFWKSSRYVLKFANGTTKSANAGFALRCLPHLRFVDRRQSNAAKSALIDEPCFHYGYVKSDAEMLEKVQTWSHAHEVVSMQTWYDLKWRLWKPSTKYLSPTDPTAWACAIEFDEKQPDFAKEFELPVSFSRKSPAQILEETWYDARAYIRDRARALKRRIFPPKARV